MWETMGRERGWVGKKHHLDELLAISLLLVLLLLLLLRPRLKIFIHPWLAVERRHIRRRYVCESLAAKHRHGIDGRLGARDGERQVREGSRNLLEGAPDNGAEAPTPTAIAGAVAIRSHPPGAMHNERRLSPPSSREIPGAFDFSQFSI